VTKTRIILILPPVLGLLLALPVAQGRGLFHPKERRVVTVCDTLDVSRPRHEIPFFSPHTPPPTAHRYERYGVVQVSYGLGLVVDFVDTKEARGDGDGLLEPGETVNLSFTVWNNSGTNGHDVCFTLDGGAVLTFEQSLFDIPSIPYLESIRFENVMCHVEDGFSGVYNAPVNVDFHHVDYMAHQQLIVQCRAPENPACQLVSSFSDTTKWYCFDENKADWLGKDHPEAGYGVKRNAVQDLPDSRAFGSISRISEHHFIKQFVFYGRDARFFHLYLEDLQFPDGIYMTYYEMESASNHGPIYWDDPEVSLHHFTADTQGPTLILEFHMPDPALADSVHFKVTWLSVS
jgi:hypothetical protein